MHVALLANTAWLDEELPAYQALVTGLLEAQVRVTQVLPDALPVEEIQRAAPHLFWHDGPWPVSRRRRLGGLADDLEKAGVDLIHALDGRLWEGALHLAEVLGVPAVLGATCFLDLPEVGRWRQPATLVGAGAGRVFFAATTAPLAQAIGAAVGGGVVAVIPPAVRPPPAGADIPHAEDAVCLALCGSGEVDDDLEALFAALHEVVRQHPQVQCFLDSQAGDPHAVWHAARRHELLGNLSLVPRRLGHRELLLSADMLIHPQALGRSRSLTLQAMAQGLPVLARADPWLDYLIEGRTALLVPHADSPAWTDRLQRLLAQPARLRDLGRSARQWVQSEYQPGAQWRQTLALYRRAAGEPIKFPQAV